MRYFFFSLNYIMAARSRSRTARRTLKGGKRRKARRSTRKRRNTRKRRKSRTHRKRR